MSEARRTEVDQWIGEHSPLDVGHASRSREQALEDDMSAWFTANGRTFEGNWSHTEQVENAKEQPTKKVRYDNTAATKSDHPHSFDELTPWMKDEDCPCIIRVDSISTDRWRYCITFAEDGEDHCRAQGYRFVDGVSVKTAEWSEDWAIIPSETVQATAEEEARPDFDKTKHEMRRTLIGDRKKRKKKRKAGRPGKKKTTAKARTTTVKAKAPSKAAKRKTASKKTAAKRKKKATKKRK